MKQFSIIISIALLFCTACTKQIQPPIQDIEIRAMMDLSSTRISYTDQGSNLTQQWEIGDCLIGYCGDKRFSYKVKAVSDGTAYLTYGSGDRLSGTESDVYMYYAPGHSYSDITSGTLALDITQQAAETALKAPMAATGSFSNGSLTLNFSPKGSILKIDRLCWLPAGSTVTAVKIYGANSRASLSGTSLNNSTSSTITITKQGGWSTDAFGEMTQTLRIPILPNNNSNSITIKAVVGGTEHTVYCTNTLVVYAGNYYYSAPYLVRMVSGGATQYFTDFSAALTAANASDKDVTLALLSNCGSNGDERTFNNTNGKKISLDLGDFKLNGKNIILSEVAFTASGTGSASNTDNVVLVNSGGNFTMTGSSLTSTSTASDNTAAPLAILGSSTSPTVQCTIDGTAITGSTSYGAAYVSYGSLTVNGNSEFSSYRAFFVTLGGRLTVNDGTCNATGTSSGQAIHVGAATGVDIDINGGMFSANTNLFNFNSDKAAEASISISGGKFSWNGTFSGSRTGSGVSITGGLYRKELTYGIPSGYSCVPNSDPSTSGTYPYMVKKD